MVDLPGFPIGFLYRLWVAARRNPCTLEILERPHLEDRQWLRIRNDSEFPTTIFEVDFSWRLSNETEFTEYETPLAWLLSDLQHFLTPGASLERPINIDPSFGNYVEGLIEVTHNRSKYPAKTRFKVVR